MLSPKTQYNLANAKTYFEEHLCAGDYYTEGKKVVGQWIGNGSEKLGLSGDVTRNAFLKLCDNLHPFTGKPLTQRHKTTRNETDKSGNQQEVANRRVFYDFTISPPKSVSILAFIGGDERIIDAHNRAAKIAMNELERFAETRVRRGGECSDRRTANIVGAVFRHDTSRALDPHLHSHCILFNATFDPVEDRWKALQNHEMLLARKYVENVYYHELAHELRRFGYDIENQIRGDFEVRGVPCKLCERFSKRHSEIDEKTKALLAREPGKATGNIDDIRSHVASKERSRKIKDVATEQLRSLWASQMSGKELATIIGLTGGGSMRERQGGPDVAKAAIAWAEDHLFDRKSVVREHEIWSHALEHARGENLSIESIHSETERADYVRDAENPAKITTREVMGREWQIVEMAKTGIRRFEAPNEGYVSNNATLAGDQRNAVTHILRSRDFATLFRGGAGTGKSYALQEVHRGLVAAGRGVCVVAPQRQQVMDLVRDGFKEAQTVSEFLTRREMKHAAVVIVDEAGQLGAKQMLELLQFVKQNDGRVILSGDTRQHGAVEASDALRAIEIYSGLTAAELTEIRRQNPEKARNSTEREFIEQYKRAVEEAADGKMAASFDRLDRAGAVEECTLSDQQERLAAQYLDLAIGRQSTVVVSQTWSEIHKVNDRVRAGLQAKKLIGQNQWIVTSLETVDLTNAQKRDKRFYQDDPLVVFNRGVRGIEKGRSGKPLGITANGLVIEVGKKIRTIPFDSLDRLTVCRRQILPLACGDRLQLKANAKAVNGERVANGELVTVECVDSGGRIRLDDGRTLASDYRQFVRGYAVTSYASQGKTVNYVLFSDSTVKAATNTQQWYVSISRGRKGVRIFTSDKVQLRQNVSRAGDRTLALDLAPLGRLPRQVLRQRRFRAATQIRRFAAALRLRIAMFIRSRRRPVIGQEVKAK